MRRAGVVSRPFAACRAVLCAPALPPAPLAARPCTGRARAAAVHAPCTILTAGGSRALPCARSPLRVEARRRSQGAQRSHRDVRLKFQDIDVSIAEEQAWRVLLPFAGLFGLAIFVGPLVVGITVSAIAVGAAFSAGAIAFSTLVLPLIILTGAGGLLSLGVMASAGALFVGSKLLFSLVSLAFVGGGLALGWGGVNWLLAQARATDSSASSASSSGGSSSAASSAAGSTQEEAAEAQERQKQAEEVRRIASELRQFDELLARKEEARRVDDWTRRS